MVEQIREEWIQQMKRRRRRKYLAWAAVLGILILITAVYNIWLNRMFEITRYHCDSEKIADSVTIAFLTDLHGKEYGEKNNKLLRAIEEEKPDLILIAGDMVTFPDSDIHVAVELCQALASIAPTYYCYGNHEGQWMHNGIDGETIPIDQYIEKTGAIFTPSEAVELEINGNRISIGGVPQGLSGYEQWGRQRVENLERSDGFRILVSHHPDLYYEKLADVQAELAVAGHFHGGLIRIPGIGGLYHPDGGIFAKYDGGQYELEHGTLIVSRGLGNQGVIPRIFNQPELVIITLESGK